MVGTIPETRTGAGARDNARIRPGVPAPKWQAGLVVLLVLILGIAGTAFMMTRKTVTLTVDGQTRQVVTHRQTVRTFLGAQRVTLGQADEVLPKLDAKLTQRATVVVHRAVPVTITVDGQTTSVLSAKETVQEALAAAGVKIGELDEVDPGLTEPVMSDQAIVIHRVAEQDKIEQQTIPYTTLRRQDSELERGQTRVVRAGVNGLRERTIRIRLKDGKQVSRTLVSERVVKEPQAQLVAVGTKKIVRTLRTSRGAVYRYTEKRRMAATAYDPGPRSIGPKATGRTYLGLKAGYGIVAVDPRVIPLRTRLYIPGYGEALAGDTGGAIKGNRIDLGFNTYEEAISFGRRKIDVYVLE